MRIVVVRAGPIGGNMGGAGVTTNGINLPVLEAAVGIDRTIGGALRLRSVRAATAELQTVCSMLRKVIPTEITDNIIGVLWSKLTYTCFGLFGSLANESLKNISATEKTRRLFVDFFAEIVDVGTATSIRFIQLNEYDPRMFHPDQPYERRLRILTDMWNGWESDDRTWTYSTA